MKKQIKTPSAVEVMLQIHDSINAVEADIDACLVEMQESRQKPVRPDSLRPVAELAARALREGRAWGDVESYRGAVRRLASHAIHDPEGRGKVSLNLRSAAFAQEPPTEKLLVRWEAALVKAKELGWPQLIGSRLHVVHAEIVRCRTLLAPKPAIEDFLSRLHDVQCADTWTALAGFAGVQYQAWDDSRTPLLLRQLPTFPPTAVADAKAKRQALIDNWLANDAAKASAAMPVVTPEFISQIEREHRLPELRAGASEKQRNYAREARVRAIHQGMNPATFARVTSPETVIERAKGKRS